MKALIAFNRDRIYTSLDTPDNNPQDSKLILLLELTHELGKFGYIIDQEALPYLSETDILDYSNTVLPILYEINYHKKYKKEKFNINLEDWKSRHQQPWVNNFYISGDFRFISESAKSLNLPIVYLDRINEDGIYKIYISTIQNNSDINQFEINELKYLVKYFGSMSKERPRNLMSILIVSLYNKNIRPDNLNDYRQLQPNRSERRLILEKLEGIDLSKENVSELKELFKILHPEEYKKIFPKTYKFFCDLKKNREPEKKNPYAEGIELLDSNKIEEFTKRFMGLLHNAVKEGSGSDADLMTLLYSNKLSIRNLLYILDELHKVELGVPRYYGEYVFIENNKDLTSLIPTIKEFLVNGISLKSRHESLAGRKVFIDESLKDFDFGSHIQRPNLIVRKLKSLKEVMIGIEWELLNMNSATSLKTLKIYLWKGPSSIFKKIPVGTLKGPKPEIVISGTTINIQKYKEKGYKYLVFDSRVVSKFGAKKSGFVNFKIISEEDNLNFKINANTRNNFGGLIDLETGDLTIINFDLKTIPTYNGNLQEAIVRYIIPEFRFSAYDFFTNHFISSGATIVDNPKDCDIHFRTTDYFKFKLE